MLLFVWIYLIVVVFFGLINWIFFFGKFVGINNGCYKFDFYYYMFVVIVGFFVFFVVIMCVYCYIFKIVMEYFCVILRLIVIVMFYVLNSNENY